MALQNTSGVIYGDQNFSLPSHMNYGKYFLDNIVNYKEKVAMINGTTGEQITYSEMAQQIVNAAAYLTRIGVKRGDVVAICSENRIEFMTTVIAVMYAGAVVTFINSAYSAGEMLHAINIAKPTYMFLSPTAYKNHYQSLVRLLIILKYFVYGEKSPDASKVMCFKDIASLYTDKNLYNGADFGGKAQTALILYSSGTTGFPKGAKLTHLNLIVAAQQPEPCSRDISILSIAPFCNCMGLLLTTDSLKSGKTYIFLNKFEEKQYLQTIQKYKIGVLVTAPPLVVMLSKSTILDDDDVSSVQVFICGGAPLDNDTIIQVKKRFPNLIHVLQGYGMTEATGALTAEREDVCKQGSVGKILPGNIIKVVDIETRKKLVHNQPGEVCVKGLVLFDGYIGKESELDDEGFYSTGDIAYYDEEGFFYIVDRLKELIKYKAWQVPPSELKAVLLQHPAVKDVGVVGIPDKLAGEVPLAFIVKKNRVTEKELMDFVASKVSPWKRLRGGVRFVEEIPKNPSGKILRRKLRELIKPVSKL